MARHNGLKESDFDRANFDRIFSLNTGPSLKEEDIVRGWDSVRKKIEELGLADSLKKKEAGYLTGK